MNLLTRMGSLWKAYEAGSQKVLAINRRNLEYVYPHNPRASYELADNKVRTKEVMRAAGVSVPETYRVYGKVYQLIRLQQDLEAYTDFVIKPARGRAGGGILVITGREQGDWLTLDGVRLNKADLQKHISDIIFGIYSFDLSDQAIVEQRIEQHSGMDALSPIGMADVRVVMFQDRPAMAMTRVPTRLSGGKANLHLGAVGVGIDMASGSTVHADYEGREISAHPDTGTDLVGIAIPHWEPLLEMSVQAAVAVPLKYLGVDIVVTQNGPILLEINARAGLNIQNANSSGLVPALKRDDVDES